MRVIPVDRIAMKRALDAGQTIILMYQDKIGYKVSGPSVEVWEDGINDANVFIPWSLVSDAFIVERRITPVP